MNLYGFVVKNKFISKLWFPLTGLPCFCLSCEVEFAFYLEHFEFMNKLVLIFCK